MGQYPNFSLTLLLAFILVPPFALTTLKPHLEPYPALILPSGAVKVKVGAKDISFVRTSLWGKQETDNTWTRIDLETFWTPLPKQYFKPIVRNSLGLKSGKPRIIQLPKGINISRNKVTPSEIQDAKYWWRQKLVQSGYASNELMITVERVKFDIETSKIIKTKRSHEEVFRLD